MKASIPKWYNILTEDDKRGYTQVRKSLDSIFASAPRSSKIANVFDSVVNELKAFVNTGDYQTDIRRALVCGIMWIDNIVALNTRQLSIVIGKCKSSINSGFQAIGYTTIQSTADGVSALTKAYPFMRTDFGEMRQWTFRACPANVSPFYEILEVSSPPPDSLDLLRPDVNFWSLELQPFSLQTVEDSIFTLTNDVF